MTTVVHKSKPYGVYIGRQYSVLPQSVYHNPYHIGRDGSRADVFLKFAVYWYAEEQRELRARARKELPYRILGCWCHVPRELCHGMIVSGYVNLREIMVTPIKVMDDEISGNGT